MTDDIKNKELKELREKVRTKIEELESCRTEYIEFLKSLLEDKKK